MSTAACVARFAVQHKPLRAAVGEPPLAGTSAPLTPRRRVNRGGHPLSR
jgi:hypothetical protein